LIYNNNPQHYAPNCPLSPYDCTLQWNITPTGPLPLENGDAAVVWGQQVAVQGQNVLYVQQPGKTEIRHYYGIWSLYLADGSSHVLGNQGTVSYTILSSPPTIIIQKSSGPFETLDATGWRVEGAFTTTANSSQFGSRVLGNPTAVIDASGVSYGSTMEDSNGNQIIASSTGLTDTLQRFIPYPPSHTSASNTDSSGCTGPLPVAKAVLWSPPGYQGAASPYKFCYATVSTNLDGLREAVTLKPITGSTVFNPLLQSIVLPNGQTWEFEYNDIDSSQIGSNGSPITYGTLTKVTLPTGGTISYIYSTVGGCGSSGRQIATRTVDANDGTGPHTWSYNGGIVTDPMGNDVVHTFTNFGGCALYETQTQYCHGSHTTGTLLKTVNITYSYARSYNAYSTAINIVPTLLVTTFPNGQTSEITKSYDSGFPYIDLTGSTSNPGGSNNIGIYGKVVSLSEYDYGNGTPGSLLRQTRTNYLWQSNSTYQINNLLNLPSSVTILNGSGSQLSATTYGYDESALASSGVSTQHDSTPPTGSLRGNLTSVSRWLNTTNTSLISRKTYFDTGTVNTATDPRNNATTLAYSSTFAGAYPTTGTNPLGQVTSSNYDFSTGRLLSSTDRNNQVTSFTYDSMWRLTTVALPDGGQATNCYTDTGGPTCTKTAPPYSVVSTRKMNATQNETTTAFVDGLGRITQTQLTSDPDCTAGDKTDTTYDAVGRVFTVSNPYCTTTDTTYGLTSYAYDALGRTTQVTHPDNTTVVTTYTGRATQVQDEGNGTQRVTRISQTDALGRLLSLCEVAPGPFVGAGGSSSSTLIGSGGTTAACGQDIAGTGFLTTYQYDALGDVLQVNQAGIAPRTFAYDSLSRLTSAGNPESGTICYGTYSAGACQGNGYDANGNLLTKTAPAPNQTGTATVTTTYQYDALNRLTQKSYNDGVTPSTTFTYDIPDGGCPSCYPNRIGRLGYASVPGWYFTYGYDPMGRPLRKDLYMSAPSGTLYHDYTYDLLGDITSESAGDGIAYNGYNTAGHLTSVTSGYSDANNPAHVFSIAGNGSDTHYNALGGLTSNTLGDGEVETYSYDTRGRLQSYTAKLNTTPIYSFNIGTFAPNGDILAANDSANGNWTYTYDPFNRLVGANQNSGQAVYNYVYDRFGNRWQQNGPHTFLATFTGNSQASPQNNNRMDGYSYDAAGNLLNDSTHSYTYDAENHIAKVDNGNTATYVYDADGNRVQKTSVTGGDYGDPPGTWQFLYDQSGHMIQRFDGTLWQGNIFAGSRHVATVGAGTFFSHSDWIGTERVRNVFTSPTYLESCSSLPFGDALTCQGNGDFSTLHFTGKEHDYESGLDYFGARFDASSFGRFMSPDEPKYSSKFDPQSWNLYSYVGNDPLGRIDPDGHNYFWVRGKYVWYDGADVTNDGNACKRGTQGCNHSDYNYLLIIQKTGHVTADGADEALITLKGPRDKVLINQAYAFSGGNVDNSYHVSTPNGRYEINLNIRGGPETNRSTPDGELVAHAGLQVIAGFHYDPVVRDVIMAQNEWGTLRANLSRLDGTPTHFYLHGKELDRASTHGCICNRDESVLRAIFKLDPNGVGEGGKRGIVAVSVQ
jgi:RHS repeat-associated protein